MKKYLGPESTRLKAVTIPNSKPLHRTLKPFMCNETFNYGQFVLLWEETCPSRENFFFNNAFFRCGLSIRGVLYIQKYV